MLNRLRRLESLLGRSLYDYKAGLALSLALLAYDADRTGTPAQR
ncbi:hypothetical protein ACFSVJ_05180 [Prauserella oleivorans]